MNESSCCGNNKNHSAGASSDKEQSCCNNEHSSLADGSVQSSCCSVEHMSFSGVSDPVCGMKVDPSKTELHAMHKGEKYYFCNINCKDSFVSDPEKYLSKKI